MGPIVAYLNNNDVPKGKTKARILRLEAACYVLYDDKLYQKGLLNVAPKVRASL